MKKSMLAASFALAAGFSSVSYSGALNFDPSTLLNNNGIAGKTHHLTFSDALYSAALGTNALDDGGAYNSSYTTPNAGSIFNTTIGCTADGLDALGDPDLFDADGWYTGLAFPWNSGAGIGVAQDLLAPDCSIDLGASGQITGGWSVADPFDIGGGAFFLTIQLLDAPRMSVNLIGATCGNAAAQLQIAQDARTALIPVLDAGTTLGAGGLDPLMATAPPAGCTLFGLQRIGLGQCDPVLGANDCVPAIAKAVPVPAFAAGILAFGLAGITYLTSRRRAIR